MKNSDSIFNQLAILAAYLSWRVLKRKIAQVAIKIDATCAIRLVKSN